MSRIEFNNTQIQRCRTNIGQTKTKKELKYVMANNRVKNKFNQVYWLADSTARGPVTETIQIAYIKYNYNSKWKEQNH